MEIGDNKTDAKKSIEMARREGIVREVTLDFCKRRENRRNVESEWILNMNFLEGKQYCDVSVLGGVAEEDKRYFWQGQRVFNHVAPVIEARVAKLTKLKPKLKIKAFSDETGDLKAAKLANGIFECVKERTGLDDVFSKGILWSETCGSCFYKVVWDEKSGKAVGKTENGETFYEGEVSITAVSPFEIYPDSLEAEGLESVNSLIHARKVLISEIFDKFGVVPDVKKSKEIYAEFDIEDDVENCAVLIERYTKPCGAFPDGKLEIVAGNELLYEGVLPYKNGERGERDFPFVMQTSLRSPNKFFGNSVIQRLIPVQRAYNAVRNRKHEFLNRLALGILTVEDGSIDVEELEDEGLEPGKVLIYRQGGKAPELMDCGKVPTEFAGEEEWLEEEFSLISGISDLTQNSTPSQVTSATGLKLLINQDDSRLAVTTENMGFAIKELAKQIIRLYKQFAGSVRLITMTGEDKKTQLYYFSAKEVSDEDIVFTVEEGVSEDTRRETVLTLMNAGLFNDENGNIRQDMKQKILDAFGYGSFENVKDLSAMQIMRAESENLEIMKGNGVEVEFYDDHAIHVDEHIRYLLGDEFLQAKDENAKERFRLHIENHKKYLNK